jgi:hypothetical protein
MKHGCFFYGFVPTDPARRSAPNEWVLAGPGKRGGIIEGSRSLLRGLVYRIEGGHYCVRGRAMLRRNLGF